MRTIDVHIQHATCARNQNVNNPLSLSQLFLKNQWTYIPDKGLKCLSYQFINTIQESLGNSYTNFL